MRGRGFTILEVLVSLAVFAVILAMILPSYRSYAQTRTVQAAGRVVSYALREQKSRAVALNSQAGLCAKTDALRSYETHPLFPASFAYRFVADLHDEFGMPVTLQITPTAPAPPQNPCSPGESQIWFSPSADPAGDWRGIIKIQSGAASWQVAETQGGVITDEP